ncbi:MAG: acylphosphatase [Bacteroidales bacterium]
MQTTYQLQIFGRVQGVSYRYWAKQTAEAMGLKGFVQNQPDGSVRIQLTGTAPKLNEFIERCFSGPPMAKVENVKTEEIPFKRFEGFNIF